jgi:hypothetical protein
MRWIAKALVQRALSAIPHGEALNYQLQRHVTRSLPASEPVFRMHIHEACRHYDAMRRHRPALAPQQAVAYEFGAGWDLVGPLTLAVLGIRHQLLVDIRENLRLQLVNDTLARLRRRRPDLERCRPEPLPELPLEPVTSYDGRPREPTRRPLCRPLRRPPDATAGRQRRRHLEHLHP